jgi:outer membrane protein OmpA-like peptidoglycan-associated protein
MELPKAGGYKEVEKNLFLVPLLVGEIIKLNNVFFIQSKALLKSESYPELDRLAGIMNENPTMVIELEGHTDNQGKKRLNLELSEKRVVAVMNYLLTKGVTPNRMTGKGFGGSQPLMPNDTEENRQMNRRVEFKIIKN